MLIKCKLAIANVTANISKFASTISEMINWFYVRLAFIAAGAVSQFVVPVKKVHEVPPEMWLAALAVFIFSIIGLQFVIGVQAFNPRSAKVWLRPSWKCNPFNLKQPLQFFHFGGWYMLAGSITYLPSATEGSKENMFLAAMQAAFGLGMLLGVRLSVILYQRKFKNV